MPQAEAGLNNLYSVLAGIRSMTADYVGHTALALQLGVERLAWMADRVPGSGVAEPAEGARRAEEVGRRGAWLVGVCSQLSP